MKIYFETKEKPEERFQLVKLLESSEEFLGGAERIDSFTFQMVLGANSNITQFNI